MPKQPTVQQARQALAAAQDQLDKAKNRREYLDNNPAPGLAEELHALLCRANHEDQCGWHFSSWDDPCHARDEYLETAEHILKRCEPEIAIEVVLAIREKHGN
jgi:hypothetical protein